VASNLSRFRGWAKAWWGAVGLRKRTEITVETDRVVIIRRHRSNRTWCRQCGSEVDLISLGEAAVVAGLPEEAFLHGAQAKGWHVLEDGEGTSLVCLESLLKSQMSDLKPRRGELL
jgi:hypothetical protein